MSPTTVLKLSLADLVQRSDAVVIGTVIAKEYGMLEGLVITRNIAEIETCIICDEKSELNGETIEIVTLGGKKSDTTSVHVFGEARFTEGERFAAFLRRQDGFWRVVGMAQGKMTVNVDKESGKALVLPPAKVNLVTKKAGNPAKDKPFMTEPLTLQKFIDRVTEMEKQVENGQ